MSAEQRGSWAQILESLALSSPWGKEAHCGCDLSRFILVIIPGVPCQRGESATDVCFFQFWRLGNLRSRHCQVGCLLRAHFRVHGQPFQVSPHLAGGMRELSYNLTLEDSILKGPNAIRFQHMNLGGGVTNIRSTSECSEVDYDPLTMGNLLHFTNPQVPNLQSGHHDSTCLSRLSWRSDEVSGK